MPPGGFVERHIDAVEQPGDRGVVADEDGDVVHRAAHCQADLLEDLHRADGVVDDKQTLCVLYCLPGVLNLAVHLARRACRQAWNANLLVVG